MSYRRDKSKRNASQDRKLRQGVATDAKHQVEINELRGRLDDLELSIDDSEHPRLPFDPYKLIEDLLDEEFFSKDSIHLR